MPSLYNVHGLANLTLNHGVVVVNWSKLWQRQRITKCGGQCVCDSSYLQVKNCAFSSPGFRFSKAIHRKFITAETNYHWEPKNGGTKTHFRANDIFIYKAFSAPSHASAHLPLTHKSLKEVVNKFPFFPGGHG